MSCNYCWPGNCCGGPNCLDRPRRKPPSLTTKLAATLRELFEIPYEHAKLMTDEQLCSLFQFHHDDVREISGNDHHSNLRPMFIAAHRARTPADRALIRKSNRVREKHETYLQLIEPVIPDGAAETVQLYGSGMIRTRFMTMEEVRREFPDAPEPMSREEADKHRPEHIVERGHEGWAKTKRRFARMQSRGFDKTKTRGFDGKVKPRKRRRR